MKSQYKYVYFKKRQAGYGEGWMARIDRKNKVKDTKWIIQKWFLTEIEAAKAVDLALIKNNEEPVNILKRI